MGSHWFDGLSDKAHGFLLASMIFRSRDFENLFSLLDESDAGRMFEKGQAIASLERAHRIELLLSELKKSLIRSSQAWIMAVHPSWLVAILKKETKEIQKVVLASLPIRMSQMVGPKLGIDAIEIDMVRQLPSVILGLARRTLEKQLEQMRSVNFELTFTPRQLLVMSKEDLQKIVNEAGVMSFSAYLAGEPNDIRRQVVQRLDYDLAQEVLGHVESGVKRESNLCSLVVRLAEKGTIDDRFAKCTQSLYPPNTAHLRPVC